MELLALLEESPSVHLDELPSILHVPNKLDECYAGRYYYTEWEQSYDQLYGFDDEHPNPNIETIQPRNLFSKDRLILKLQRLRDTWKTQLFDTSMEQASSFYYGLSFNMIPTSDAISFRWIQYQFDPDSVPK